MDEAKEAVASAVAQADSGLRSASQTVLHGIASVLSTASTSFSAMSSAVSEAADASQDVVQQAMAQAQHAEDVAVSGIKSTLAYAAANPVAANTAMGCTLLLALPGTRRLLWRQTFGRLSNPESVLRNSAERVQKINAHVTDHAAQLSKLHQRMLSAEAEYKSGYSKLKSTRVELQRLASYVAKDEKVANAVVEELRPLKAMEASLGIRAEAASHAAVLRTQRSHVKKDIKRIMGMDI